MPKRSPAAKKASAKKPAAGERPLPPKQQRFVQEYLIDLCASKAAARAGYSEKSAKRIGHWLMGEPRVQAAVQAAMAERSKRTEITADMVLQELAKIGFSDAWHYRADDDGQLVLADDAPGGATRAVASVKRKRRVGEHGVETTTEFRLWDKNTALQAIGKHLGMFVERVEHTGKVLVMRDVATLEGTDD